MNKHFTMEESTKVLLLSMLFTVSVSGAPQTPQLCLNGTAGGLNCRCTTFLTEMAQLRSEVDCSSRNISTLPADWTISQLVRRLDLSRNMLSSLRNEQFSHWGNLEEINLSRNRFRTLNENAFVGLSNLRVLDLSFNLLTTLPANIFNGLTILTNLNLEMNRLEKLDPAVFNPTPHLQSLKLSYNLALGKNLILSKEAFIVIFKNNLTSLTMNNMSITSIPKNLFNEATNLRYLSLADNPLKLLEILPASLESLNLSGTEIDVILPGEFVYYPYLKKLQLDRLLLLKTVESNAFEDLTSLEELTMENCIQLHTFDELAFGGEIDSKPVPLQRLSLARSGLHSLSSRVFAPVSSTLKKVDLQGNPWDCDCMFSWILNVNFTLEDRGYLRCFYPDHHHNKLALSLRPEDFSCDHSSSEHRMYNGFIVMLDAVLVLLVLAVCCTILVVLWRRSFFPCKSRETVGRYSHVNIEPNRAELEWDDKDLDHIWTTPTTKESNTPVAS